MLQIHLLGEMRIVVDGESQPPPTSLKARLVLAHLSETTGNLARQVLAERFWDTPPSSAIASLNTELKNLRRSLGSSSGLLVARRGLVGLPQCDDLWVDVREFAEHLRRGQHAESLELWQGDFLQDTSGEWADQARTRYRRMVGKALSRLADEYEEAGDLAAAAEYARRQRDLLPDELEGWKRLFRVLTANGDLLAADTERRELLARHVNRGLLPQAVRDAVGADTSAVRSDRPEPREHGAPPKDEVLKGSDSSGGERSATLRRVPGAAAAEELVGPAPRSTSPVYTGFSDLDQVLDGLPEPGLSVIAGRPGMGASTLALCIAANASLDFGVATALCSIESSEAQLAQRLVGMRAAITSTELRRGVPEHKWMKLLNIAQVLAAAPLWIDDSPQLEMSSLFTRLEQLKTENELRLVVIDSIHGFTRTGGPALDSQSIAGLLFALRKAARQLELSVIVTMEVLGDCEKRWDKRPQLRDLPCYFELAAPRDVVLLLYRDEHYDIDSERVGELDVIVAENRGGPVGCVTLTFDARIPRLLNFSASTNTMPVSSVQAPV